MLADRLLFSPRIGRSLALGRAAIRIRIRLFSYWPVLCIAAGIKSLIAFARAWRTIGEGLGRFAVVGQGSGGC
jgi:hypothetical protein